MTGFNLPPGCEVHHIPGNRPEDLEEEAFWDRLSELLEQHGLHFEDLLEDDRVQALVEHAREVGYERGLRDGRAEEQIAQGQRETEAAEERLRQQRGGAW